MQVIIDAQGKPLRRLQQTVAAVRDTSDGFSHLLHIIYDARSAACQPCSFGNTFFKHHFLGRHLAVELRVLLRPQLCTSQMQPLSLRRAGTMQAA